MASRINFDRQSLLILPRVEMKPRSLFYDLQAQRQVAGSWQDFVDSKQGVENHSEIINLPLVRLAVRQKQFHCT